MTHRRCARLFLICIALLNSGGGQQRVTAKRPYPPTLWVPCDAKLSPNSTRTGPAVVSHAGEHSAKVTVKLSWPGGTCFNTVSLWVADAGSSAEKARTIFVYRPQSLYSSGAGMNLVDWSPDGRLLLTEFWRWNQMPTDEGIDKGILLFSANGKTRLEIDTAQFLADQEGKNCWLEFKLLGFTPGGQIAMRTDITPYYEAAQEPSEVPPDKTCEEKHQTWAVDPRTQKREPLPASYRAKRYSEIRPIAAAASH
jgi:hypothetical protein